MHRTAQGKYANMSANERPFCGLSLVALNCARFISSFPLMIIALNCAHICRQHVQEQNKNSCRYRKSITSPTNNRDFDVISPMTRRVSWRKVGYNYKLQNHGSWQVSTWSVVGMTLSSYLVICPVPLAHAGEGLLGASAHGNWVLTYDKLGVGYNYVRNMELNCLAWLKWLFLG